MSRSPNSEVIDEVKFNWFDGFWKILLKVIEDELPLVKVFPSAGLVATILIPPEGKFSIRKEPKVIPEEISIASIKAWSGILLLDEDSALT